MVTTALESSLRPDLLPSLLPDFQASLLPTILISLGSSNTLLAKWPILVQNYSIRLCLSKQLVPLQQISFSRALIPLTRRPQLRNNPKSDKVPVKSKSSCLSNKLEKIEENHRSLQSSNYPNHTSSKCNNIKLAIRNEKSKVICATCKQCLITANHDDYVLQYVNGMKSRMKNQSANVSKSDNQRKHKPRVWKPKKVGSKERLASPKPITPRSCLRWLPTGGMFYLKGKIIATSESQCQPDYSKGDNACTSNP
ncbi:hypothetical protein Tco_0000063 [Tanacetum coccineum]